MNIAKKVLKEACALGFQCYVYGGREGILDYSGTDFRKVWEAANACDDADIVIMTNKGPEWMLYIVPPLVDEDEAISDYRVGGWIAGQLSQDS